MNDIGTQDINHKLERDKPYSCVNKGIDGDPTFNDGYKWHKYGQKSLMENTLIRSYYRCSNKGSRCRAKKCIDHIKKEKIRITTYSFEHNHPPPVSGMRVFIHERSMCKLSKQDNFSSTSSLTIEKGVGRSSLGEKKKSRNDGLNNLELCKTLEFISPRVDCNSKIFVDERSSSENSGDLEIEKNKKNEAYERENSELASARVEKRHVREGSEVKNSLKNHEDGGFPLSRFSSDTLASYSDSPCNSISQEIDAGSLMPVKSLNSMGGNTYENLMLFLGGQSTISVFDFIESECVS